MLGETFVVGSLEQLLSVIVFTAPIGRIETEECAGTVAAFDLSFNGTFRDELLNETLFTSLAEARVTITAWVEHYNRTRPHSSLGNLTPQEFAMKTRLETKAA